MVILGNVDVEDVEFISSTQVIRNPGEGRAARLWHPIVYHNKIINFSQVGRILQINKDITVIQCLLHTTFLTLQV